MKYLKQIFLGERNESYLCSKISKKIVLTLICLILLPCTLIGIASAEGFCVTSEPAGVRYYIDGVYIGETKPNDACVTDYATVWTTHTVTYEKEGYENYSFVQKADEMGYGVYRIHHVMRSLSKADPFGIKSTSSIQRTKGDIDFYCQINNVDVFLNGNKIHNSNTEDRFESNDLQPGTYLIEAKKQGYSVLLPI